MQKYRERIFQYYVNAWHKPLAPENISGLTPRAPYLNKLIREHFPYDRTARLIDLGSAMVLWFTLHKQLVIKM
jgi:hypothetical protein